MRPTPAIIFAAMRARHEYVRVWAPTFRIAVDSNGSPLPTAAQVLFNADAFKSALDHFGAAVELDAEIMALNEERIKAAKGQP